MTSSGYREAFDDKEALDRLLEQAAVERDRSKFLELLGEINRLRAARSLASGLKRLPDATTSSRDTDSFDLFAGPPDRDAGWIETVVGFDKAKARLDQLASAAPG